MKILVLLFIVFANSSFANLRVASYNIRNFDYDERSNVHTNKKHLVSLLEEMKPDLMAVQEINETEVFDTMINNHFYGQLKTILSECGGSHGQRLGFIYNPQKFILMNFKEDLRTVNPSNPHQADCHEGSRPLAVATFKRVKTNQTIIAISVHLKSGGQPKSIKKRFQQINMIKDVINEHKAQGFEHFIVMGDFNSTEYINRDSKPHRDFKQTVAQMGALDLSSQLSCTSYWWGGMDDFTQYPSLLDHIIISTSLTGGKMPAVQTYGHCAKLNCEATSEADMGISFDEVSDHCPVAAEIN